MPKIPTPSSVWKGPEHDGITQSKLNLFLFCRERFRLRMVEGLQSADVFKRRLEYGNMFHLCEETLRTKDQGSLKKGCWLTALTSYAKKLCKRYPLEQTAVDKWYNVCKVQFPIYVRYWKKNQVKGLKPISREEQFSVLYTLPSGRKVRLRGKVDGEDAIGKEHYLVEHKTKGEVDDGLIRQQLQFDLQTMFYLCAMELLGRKLNGVRYNIIRRPLSGGKGSIRPLKNVNAGKKGPDGKKLPPRPESDKEYYARLGGIIAEEPDHYFMRFPVEVTPADVERFKREFLNPILEQLCDWWEWIRIVENPDCYFQSISGIHWRTPYGIWNPIAKRGFTDLDEYLASGSMTGLTKTDKVFKELEEDNAESD